MEGAFGIARSAECVGGGVVGDQIDAFRRRSSSSSFIIPSEYSSILQLRTGRATRKRLMIPNETLAQSGKLLSRGVGVGAHATSKDPKVGV